MQLVLHQFKMQNWKLSSSFQSAKVPICLHGEIWCLLPLFIIMSEVSIPVKSFTAFKMKRVPHTARSTSTQATRRPMARTIFLFAPIQSQCYAMTQRTEVAVAECGAAMVNDPNLNLIQTEKLPFASVL